MLSSWHAAVLQKRTTKDLELHSFWGMEWGARAIQNEQPEWALS